MAPLRGAVTLSCSPWRLMTSSAPTHLRVTDTGTIPLHETCCVPKLDSFRRHPSCSNDIATLKPTWSYGANWGHSAGSRAQRGGGGSYGSCKLPKAAELSDIRLNTQFDVVIESNAGSNEKRQGRSREE